MKILFIQTNMNRNLMPLPIGPAMVAAQLKHDGHDLRFVDLMGEADPVLVARLAAREMRPDLMCASIRNRDNQSKQKYDDPLPRIREVLTAVQQECAAPLLLGGTAFTTFPRRMLEYFDADYGVAGDSLEAVSRFVRSLESHPAAAGIQTTSQSVISSQSSTDSTKSRLPQGDVAGSVSTKSRPKGDLDTPGLVFRNSEGEIIERPFTITGYPRVRHDYHELIDRKRYRKTYWNAAVITRSGCPELCNYCDTYRTFGRDFTLRDPADIVDELLYLKRERSTHSVWLVDAGFNRPLDHAKEVLSEIIRKGAKMRFFGVFDPGQADREFFQLYRRAGGAAFTMFAESLSDPVLEALGKSFGAAEIFRDAKMIREEGLGFMFMPTFGSPGETRASVETTLRLTPALKALFVDFGIGWRLQPGTGLQQRAIDEGVISADDDLWKPTFYISPETPAEWVEQRIRRFRRRHPLLFIPMIPFSLRMMLERPWNSGPTAL
ncbi:MAG: radical SAM protein [Bacteroidota bacterium]